RVRTGREQLAAAAAAAGVAAARARVAQQASRQRARDGALAQTFRAAKQQGVAQAPAVDGGSGLAVDALLPGRELPVDGVAHCPARHWRSTAIASAATSTAGREASSTRMR